MSRVSVLMPAYDAAATIAEAIASVQEQSYGDWELVIADDGSRDETVAVVQALARADRRIRLVRTGRNGGPAAARNAAARHATGELVALLDADDAYLPTYLERQVAVYDAESARPLAPVGFVACDAFVRDAEGVGQKTYLSRAGVADGSAPTVAALLRGNTVFIAALLPRSAGEEVQWFDERRSVTEDYDLWLKLLERGYRGVVVREPLAIYRRRAGSMSSDIARQARNNCGTLRAALARGRLPAAERRIARAELRYNEALEAVATAVFARHPALLFRRLPITLWVAVSRPGRWFGWVRALVRGG